MKLNKIPKNELELLSYTEIAKMYLKENKTTMNTANLFKEICKLLELSENDYVEKIADFFQTLSTSKEFILLDDGNWDLKSNHKLKIVVDEDDEDEEEENEEENAEELQEQEEPDDLDSINEDDSYIDDDSDDELAELTIVNDDEIEE